MCGAGEPHSVPQVGLERQGLVVHLCGDIPVNTGLQGSRMFRNRDVFLAAAREIGSDARISSQSDFKSAAIISMMPKAWVRRHRCVFDDLGDLRDIHIDDIATLGLVGGLVPYPELMTVPQ